MEHQTNLVIMYVITNSRDSVSTANNRQNTNVIELYSRLEASDKQWNYYNSGVGTITKPKSVWKWITQNFDKTVDLAIAWCACQILLIYVK